MDFEGIIIEESLSNPAILSSLTIVSTKVEPVTDRHKTPWLQQWTLHTIMIPAESAEKIAHKLSHEIDRAHAWYIDFKNSDTHFIVFKDKVFRIDRNEKEQYDAAISYGITLGIPAYQLDFSS